jgi:LuxR family maltose regulon positive regulatory protein
MELIHSRLRPPLDMGDLAIRPNLMAYLDKVRRTPMTFVRAPAGFGKTSLLSQWYYAARDDGVAVGWLRVDASDPDPRASLVYLAAAVGSADSELTSNANKLNESERYLTTEAMLTGLSNLLSELKRPILLFIDDAHLWSEEVLVTVSRVIDLAGTKVGFVLSSRTALELGLPRARARGRLVELTVEQLRFSMDETSSYMRDVCRLDLADDEMTLVHQSVEGWVTGLKLLGLSLSRDDWVQHSARKTGHWLARKRDVKSELQGIPLDVAEFIEDEIFVRLPAPIQEFMLKTSVLDPFSLALSHAVTEQADARESIGFIMRSGLFLQQLDGELPWYRYHHLMAAFLRKRLNERHENLVPRLLDRASRWFESSGLNVEAIEYAIQSGQNTRAANLLEACCLDMVSAGQLRLVGQFAQQMPLDLLKAYPNVLLTWSWLLIRNLRFEETRQLLAIVRRTLGQMAGNAPAQDSSITKLRFLLAHREMTLAAAEDKLVLVEEQCQALFLQDGDHVHPYMRGTICSHLLYAQREQFKFDDLDRLAATGQGILSRSGISFALISLQSLVGQSLFLAGRSDLALKAFEQGYQVALRYGGEKSGLAALPGMPMAALLYDQDQLALAQALLDDGLPLITELGWVDQILPGIVTRARIQTLQGDHSGAMGTLDDGMRIALDRSLERLRLGVVCERIKLLMREGASTAKALDYAKAAGLNLPIKAVLPKGQVTTTDEFRAFAWVRIAQAQDRLTDGLQVAKQWSSFCAGKGAGRSLILWNILMAKLYFLSGETRSAQRALRQAVSSAAPIRAIRCFLDEGPVIETLLRSTKDSGFDVGHPADQFASELLSLLDPLSSSRASKSVKEAPKAVGLFGQLSSKERDILDFVGVGMRNREIADRIGTTEAAVKWHLQQIYDKVGTRRRSQAVLLARQMGLVR